MFQNSSKKKITLNFKKTFLSSGYQTVLIYIFKFRSDILEFIKI